MADGEIPPWEMPGDGMNAETEPNPESDLESFDEDEDKDPWMLTLGDAKNGFNLLGRLNMFMSSTCIAIRPVSCFVGQWVVNRRYSSVGRESPRVVPWV